MATVYRARQMSIHRDVALKVISLDASTGEDDEFRRRFEHEANLIASLEHIHVLPIYDYGIVDNELAFLAMRLLRGGSASDLIRGGSLDFERTADIFTQIATGLGYAHSRGIIHRDLKPSNILLDNTGNAYLTDFGLAKLLEDTTDLTKTGSIVGTPVYMAPEQLRGLPLSPRTDIYSMGVILYHMLAGRPPFDGADQNMVSIIYHHLETVPDPPATHNPSIPPALNTVVMKALSKAPEDRYSSAEAMAAAVNSAMGRKQSSTATVVSAPTPVSSVADAATRTISRTPPPVPVETSVPPEVPKASPTLPVSPAPMQNRRLVAIGAAVVALAALAGIVLFVLPAMQRENVPFPQATVVSGQVGNADDARPTDQEAAIARQVMGDEGFIAYITCTLDSEYHATQTREMRDFAEDYGLDFRPYDAQADPYRQITQIERARTDGAKAIIFCPLDPEPLESALTSVQRAGIPIVFLSATMPQPYGGVFLAGDDYQMGYAAGRAGGDLIHSLFDGDGEVVILDYPELPHIVTRANGLRDGLAETAPEARIVSSVRGGIREYGRASVEQLLEDGVQFNTILSINDAGSFGAIDALEEADISPDDVVISSVDAEAPARDFIRNDYFIRASVDVGREQFSRVAIDAIVRLLGGATIPETILVPPGRVITRDVLLQATAEAG